MTSVALVVDVPDLPKHVGETLGPSSWITVDQAMIDKFAEATGDHQCERPAGHCSERRDGSAGVSDRVRQPEE